MPSKQRSPPILGLQCAVLCRGSRHAALPPAMTVERPSLAAFLRSPLLRSSSANTRPRPAGELGTSRHSRSGWSRSHPCTADPANLSGSNGIPKPPNRHGSAMPQTWQGQQGQQALNIYHQYCNLALHEHESVQFPLIPAACPTHPYSDSYVSKDYLSKGTRGARQPGSLPRNVSPGFADTGSPPPRAGVTAKSRGRKQFVRLSKKQRPGNRPA